MGSELTTREQFEERARALIMACGWHADGEEFPFDDEDMKRVADFAISEALRSHKESCEACIKIDAGLPWVCAKRAALEAAKGV